VAVSVSPAEKKQSVVEGTPTKKEPPVETYAAAPVVHVAGRRAPAGRSAQVVPKSTARDPRQA
jgi:hypothetical protein